MQRLFYRFLASRILASEMRWHINTITLVLLFLGRVASQSEGPVVKIPSGVVMGRYATSFEGRNVSAFEGIPYAKPPVGNLRFAEPLPEDPWNGTLVVNKTYVCMQYTPIVPRPAVIGVEDCLYLYVYVPRERINETENLDVVVYIHGGGFISGAPTSSSGPGYILDQDLIYVSINFRLGILGFLSTQDEVIPGNNGLKDQVLALKWIKNNIKYFGGNPDSVTLLGSSSGAACVHYHYFSPLSKGLFHRGISQSGTALHKWALTKNPKQHAAQLGNLLRCFARTSKELLECLRLYRPEQVTLALSRFFVFANLFPSSPFGPVVEPGPESFLPRSPRALLKEGKFNDVPWITSNVKDEGVVPVGFFILFGNLPVLDRRWGELLPYIMGYHDLPEAKRTVITKKISDFYLKRNRTLTEYLHDLIKLCSDGLFLADGFTAVRLHANSSKSSVYYSLYDYMMDVPIAIKTNLSVVAHGDDTSLLYQPLESDIKLSDFDRKMKDILVQFLYDFASTGKTTVNGMKWDPVANLQGSIPYMHISSPSAIARSKATEVGDSKFWNSLY